MKHEAISSLPSGVTSAPAAPPRSSKKRKRKEDEIDALFNASPVSKVKKAALGNEEDGPLSRESAGEEAEFVDRYIADKELQDVLGALKKAPKGEKRKKKRKS
jgi:nucleolar protein 9